MLIFMVVSSSKVNDASDFVNDDKPGIDGIDDSFSFHVETLLVNFRISGNILVSFPAVNQEIVCDMNQALGSLRTNHGLPGWARWWPWSVPGLLLIRNDLQFVSVLIHLKTAETGLPEHPHGLLPAERLCGPVKPEPLEKLHVSPRLIPR
jgi:hypothetical protein